MQEKVVVGSQDDALRGLTRFSDNEGDIIWPAWRAELKQRVAFEFGKIGNQIIEGEVKESDTANGEVTVNIHALINALIPEQDRASTHVRTSHPRRCKESRSVYLLQDVQSMFESKHTV